MDEKKTYLINIESNLKEHIDLLKEAKKANEDNKKAVDDLKSGQFKSREEIELTNAAYRDSKKAVSDATKLVDLATKANKAKSGSYEQLLRQHQLMQTALKLEGGMMIQNTDGTYKLTDKYIQLSKKVDEAKKGIDAFGKGIHDNRLNVGNYGEAVNVAREGVSKLSSAIGGVTGEIGNMVAEFATGGGVIGAFTAIIGAMAMAWKRTQENIELYLKSADKLKFGFAGYEKDAATAQEEARRRASGQISTGVSSLTEANRIMAFGGSTAEQKEQARLMAAQAKLMIEEGKAFKDQVTGIKDKITWTLKYNKLLQEDKAISNEKLEKEIEWAGLEAKLTEQRAIAGKEGATELQIKNAAIEADKIATELAQDKIMFINTQIDNINAIADMTFTQAEQDERVNVLLKERNNVQREYYANQIKINRIGKTKGTPEEIAAAGLDRINIEINKLPTDNIELKNLQIHKDIKTDELAFNKDIADQNNRLIEESARISKWEADQYILDLDIKRQAAVSGLSSIASILGEQTELGKAFAVAAATIDTYGAAAKALNDPTIPSTIARIALMSSVILAGIANVKQIMSVKVSKNAPAPSAISASAPAQRTFANQAGSTILTQQQLSQNQLNALPNQNLLTADDIARALSKMPPPVVTVEDINAKTKAVNKVVVRANI